MTKSVESYCDIEDRDLYDLFELDQKKYKITDIRIIQYRLVYPGILSWISCDINISSDRIQEDILKVIFDRYYTNPINHKVEESYSIIHIFYRKNLICIFQQFHEKKENTFDRLDQIKIKVEYKFR